MGGRRIRGSRSSAAGGSGERLGADGPKAFVDVRRPAAARVEPRGPRARSAIASWSSSAVAAPDGGRRRTPTAASGVVGGGVRARTRCATRSRAAPEAEIAVVHDAARPLLTAELVERCVAAIARTGRRRRGRGGAGRPTRSRRPTAPAACCARSTARALWAIQTPQVLPARGAARARSAPASDVLAAATDDAGAGRGGGRRRCAIVEAPRDEPQGHDAGSTCALAELLLRRAA